MDLKQSHGIHQQIVRIMILCLLILPIIFLLTHQNFYTTNAKGTDPNCPVTPDDDELGVGGGGGGGTPWRRLGSFYDPGTKTWHCSGGGDATSCGGSKDKPGGVKQPTNPTPTDDPKFKGIIDAYAFYSSDIQAIKTCNDLEDCRTTGHHNCGGQYFLGTNFFYGGIGPYTQTDDTGISVTAKAPHTYFATVTNVNTLYSPYIYCHNHTGVTSWTTGQFLDLKAYDTITFLVGFLTPPLPWVQVMGEGNTYANKLYSKMPLQINNDLLFDKTVAELSDQEYLLGTENISTKNWNTNNGMMAKDWYAFYTARLAQATQIPYQDGGSKPIWTGDSTYTVYTTNWVIMFIIVIFPPRIGMKCGF